MKKRKFIQIISTVLILCVLSLPVYAEANITREVIEQQMVIPLFTNITLFQNGFTISATGKAEVRVYLTGTNITSVKVEASLQQNKNGTWTTIKSWTNTSNDTNSELAGSFYVTKGYSYRVVSKGMVYSGNKLIETTTNTSATKTY